MANSRELVECVSAALNRPLTEVIAHMRALRESGLVTHRGRGITAPQMTYEDAALLICSLYSTELIKHGVASVLSLKSLPVKFQDGVKAGHGKLPHARANSLLGWEPANGVVAGVSAALRLLGPNVAIAQSAALRLLGPNPEIAQKDFGKLGISLSVQFPEHFAALTVSIDGVISEVWTYGHRGQPRTRQTRECNQEALREIASCLETP